MSVCLIHCESLQCWQMVEMTPNIEQISETCLVTLKVGYIKAVLQISMYTDCNNIDLDLTRPTTLALLITRNIAVQRISFCPVFCEGFYSVLDASYSELFFQPKSDLFSFDIINCRLSFVALFSWVFTDQSYKTCVLRMHILKYLMGPKALQNAGLPIRSCSFKNRLWTYNSWRLQSKSFCKHYGSFKF